MFIPVYYNVNEIEKWTCATIKINQVKIANVLKSKHMIKLLLYFQNYFMSYTNVKFWLKSGINL